MQAGLVSWRGVMGGLSWLWGRCGFGSCRLSLNCRILVFVEEGEGVTTLALHSPSPLSSHLPRQPVIHPVCELNECNEACCPYCYTQTHTPSHTHDKPSFLCLHQYFPSIYSHQGSCLCNRACARVRICLCASLCVAEHVFLLSSTNNRQRWLTEGMCACLVYLVSVYAC